MTNRLMAHPVTKTVVLISLAAAGVITACHSAHDASRTKDISTDLGGKAVTYYYKINGDEIVRSRCQAGESTPSFCQEDSKSVPLDRFKAALGLRTNSIDEVQRQRLYGLLGSGIVFRPLTGNDLLLELRPVITEMDVAFDNAWSRWVDVTRDHNGIASDCNLNPTDCSMKDLKTGLTWSQYQGDMNWDKASGQCDNLNDSGHDDWRLPSIDELRGAFQSEILAAAAPNWIPKGTLSHFFWSSSSSTNSSGTRGAFLMNVLVLFDEIYIDHYQVVCVR